MILKPNDCLCFGVDSGEVSGWGLMYKEWFIAAGVAKTHPERKAAFDLAIQIAIDRNKPLVVSHEIWTPGWDPQKRSFKSIVGTGASWGRWEPVFEEARFPESRIFGVDPNEWRQKILSLRRGKYNREHAKQTAILYCKARGWYNSDQVEITHDQAEGTLVGFYSVYDPRVAEAIKNPSRLRKLK